MSSVPRETPDPSANSEILKRVNRARGLQLARSGTDTTWASIGRTMGWASATTTDVSSGRRSLRPSEIMAISKVLNCSPGWLAFGEGRPFPVPEVTPGVPMDDTEEDALEAVARDMAAQPQPRAKPLRRVAEGGKGRSRG